MDENEERARVVAEARRWLGTPYHSHADLVGVGVDCGMLLVRVFVDTGLCDPFDPRPYPRDWHLHRSDEKYLGFVFERTGEVALPKPGDVALFHVGRVYAHGAIVSGSDPIRIIHAYSRSRKVIEEVLSTNVELTKPQRAVRYFSHWALR